MAITSLILVPIRYFLVDETVYFYHIQGKFEKCYQLMHKIGLRNRQPLEISKSECLQLLKSVESDEDDSDQTISFIKMFTFSLKLNILITKVAILMCLSYIIYFALALEIGSLPGDINFNIIIGGCMDFLGGCLLFKLLIDVPKLGRKGSIILTFLLTAIFIFLAGILKAVNHKKSDLENQDCEASSDDDGIKMSTDILDIFITILTFSAKFTISACFNIVIQYSTECFPTKIRATAYGFINFVSCLSGVVYPFILSTESIFTWLPNLLMAVISLLGVLLGFTIFETLGSDPVHNLSL